MNAKDETSRLPIIATEKLACVFNTATVEKQARYAAWHLEAEARPLVHMHGSHIYELDKTPTITRLAQPSPFNGEQWTIQLTWGGYDRFRHGLRSPKDRRVDLVMSVTATPVSMLEQLNWYEAKNGKDIDGNGDFPVFRLSGAPGAPGVFVTGCWMEFKLFHNQYRALFYRTIVAWKSLSLGQLEKRQAEVARETSVGNMSAGHDIQLAGDQIHEFQLALLDAFTLETLCQMTTIYLSVQLEAVAGGNNLSEITFNLIAWARREGRVPDLLKAATTAVPGNPRLASLLQSLS